MGLDNKQADGHESSEQISLDPKLRSPIAAGLCFRLNHKRGLLSVENLWISTTDYTLSRRIFTLSTVFARRTHNYLYSVSFWSLILSIQRVELNLRRKRTFDAEHGTRTQQQHRTQVRKLDAPAKHKLRKGNAAYFKSTDGHNNNWSFNLRRPNLHLLPILVQHGGCVCCGIPCPVHY